MNLFVTIQPFGTCRQWAQTNICSEYENKWHSQLQPLDLDLLKDHVGTDKYFGMHYQPII